MVSVAYISDLVASATVKTSLSALALSAVALLVVLTPAPASAQTESVSQEGPGISEIVVTARRRSENIENVPISMAAISGNSLAEHLVTMTEDLSQILPNVQFSPVAPSSGNNATSAIFIRGVGQTDFLASTDPGVGFYVDGVYFARSAGTAVSLLDVDQMEILRGPQGTLFGRNTIGGAIQVTANKPTFTETNGNVSETLGDYRRKEETAALNIPLSDTFAIRLAVLGKNEEGYVTNVLTGRDLSGANTLATRLSALWKPADSFDLLWVTDYMSDHSNGTPTVFGGINTSAQFVEFAAGDAGCPGYVPGTPVPENNNRRCPNNQYLALGPYQVAAEADTVSRIKLWGTALTATWHADDWMTVKSITSYRETKPYSLRDADGTPLIILETINQDDMKQVTQELQFVGDALDSRLHWQAGAYYFHETDPQFYPVYLPAQVGGLDAGAFIKNESSALFTQETFDFTRQLQGTIGVRYTNDTKEATPETGPSPPIAADGYGSYGYYFVPYPAPSTSFVCLGATPAVLPCTGSSKYLYAPVLNKMTDSKTTPMASLQYRWSPQLMTYVSYSQGYKSGGFNTRIAQPVPTPNDPSGRELLPSYGPEQVTSYEVGAKVTFGQVARMSFAAFDAPYKDIQIEVREGVAPVLQNAGNAIIKGFEFEGSVTPMKEVSVDFGVGYTDFRYTSLSAGLLASEATLEPGALGRIDLSDTQAYTPRWSANLGVSYTIATGVGAFVPRVDGSFRSLTYFDAPNTPEIDQPTYEVYNASMRFTDTSKRYSATAGVTNFTDKAYRISGNSSLDAVSGYAEVTYAPPRQWFLAGSAKF